MLLDAQMVTGKDQGALEDGEGLPGASHRLGVMVALEFIDERPKPGDPILALADIGELAST